MSYIPSLHHNAIKVINLRTHIYLKILPLIDHMPFQTGPDYFQKNYDGEAVKLHHCLKCGRTTPIPKIALYLKVLCRTCTPIFTQADAERIFKKSSEDQCVIEKGCWVIKNSPHPKV